MPNEIQTLRFSPAPTAGIYTLTFGSDGPATLNWNDNSATIQAALEGSPSIGTGNVSVSGEADAGTITLTFQGTLANTNLPQTTCDASGLTGQGSIGLPIETVVGRGQYALSWTNCYGQIFISNSSGSVQADTTTTASALQAILVAASGDSSVTVDGNITDTGTQSASGYEIYSGSFVIQYGLGGIAYFGGGPFSANFNDTADHPSDFDTNGVDPSSGTAEVQSIPAPTAMSGAIEFSGSTNGWAFNDTIANVQAAFDTQSGPGVVTISGTDGGGPWLVTWNAPGPQNLIGLDPADLVSTVTATAGTAQEGAAPIVYGLILQSAMISCGRACA